MADQSIPLSVYLLRSDRVAAFEAALSVGTAALPLASPLDGYAVALPSIPRTPEWVPVIQSVLQSPTGFSMVGQSAAAFLVVRQGGRTFVMTFGYAWAKLDDDWLEPDFGRRIALNLIPPESTGGNPCRADICQVAHCPRARTARLVGSGIRGPVRP
jgi:uncharacterized protein (TIGR04141 family)